MQIKHKNIQKVLLEINAETLGGADLGGADLRGATLPTGEKWESYLSEVVPALLVAGGRTMHEIVASDCWDCHSWDNCPMAFAFNIGNVSDGPILLRPRIEQFVQFFDVGLIPKPALPEGVSAS